MQRCPTGKVLPTLNINAYQLSRKNEGGRVELTLDGLYVTSAYGSPLRTRVRRFNPSLQLVFPDGSTRPVEPKEGWSTGAYYDRSAYINLPDVPDGDYKLRATVRSPLGEVTAEAPVRLYAPAQIHLLTDSPIYKRGQQIRFRSVLMRRSDLGPIEGRPGLWTVRDPSGTVVLEEKATAASFGIAASSFPLDDEAPEGMWTIRFESGSDSAEQQVEVKPFTLPRFTVDLTPAQTAFFPGDQIGRAHV